MPSHPKKPCAHSGCINLVPHTERYCEEHTKVRYKSENATRKSGRSAGYGAAWEKIRKIKMGKNPLCEMCEKENRVTAGQCVHHIKELKDGGTHDMENLMTLCFNCHNIVHKRFGG